MAVPGTVFEVTDQSFAGAVESAEGLVIVDFWAEWCGPCRMIAPILEQIAVEYADRGVSIAKLDVDTNPSTAARFGIRAIPSLLFFRGGEVVAREQGAQPKAMLARKLDALLT